MIRRIRGMIDKFKRRERGNAVPSANEHEFCPRCDANLTLQKGYTNTLPYWVCKGCGEMLINPEVQADSDIAWFCDGCGQMLNIQEGFREDCGKWICKECGEENDIIPEEVYSSEEEYQIVQSNPYKGLTDDEKFELSRYQEEGPISGKDSVILVKDKETGELYVKKVLSVYRKSVYEYLRDHPVPHVSKIEKVYESANCLILIEKFIPGSTVETLISGGPLPRQKAVDIAVKLCDVLNELHNLPTPIVHRDIKPSNIIVTPDGDICLIDLNVAKWYDPDRSDDTGYLGTMNYAAPEQAGYGIAASSTESDIYATGVLLNVMLTGKFPKEQLPEGVLQDIIRQCIDLDADRRPTASQLAAMLTDAS